MKRPLNANEFPPLDDNQHKWAGLVTSLPKEHSYKCEIEGQLPKDISGTLYRLGPGLYDRGKDRKRMVLDGDGMMQEFCIRDGQVHYRNQFVRTKKFTEEEKANRFLYPTLSTHSSGPWYENLGITLPHQANITPLYWGDRLLAFDESQKPYELNPADLATISEIELDGLQPKLRYWAHWKMDPRCQQVHFLALDQGPVLKAHIVSMSDDFKVAGRRSVNLPRASYFHDWFFTEDYFGFVLHPAIVSLKTLAKVGLGIDTFSDALKWQPEKGNIIFLFNRNTGKEHIFEAPACWMWHCANAYQFESEIFVDFIGSEEGGGLGDPESPLFTIMQNNDLKSPLKSTNHLRRYHIDLKGNNIKYETLAASGNYELPTVSPNQQGRKHDHTHFIRAQNGELFARGLAEWDSNKQELSSYSSQSNEFFSEPLSFATMKKSSAYISSLVYDGDRRLSYLGIFRVGHLQDGPIAKVWLKHHAPLGFHGYWRGDE